MKHLRYDIENKFKERFEAGNVKEGDTFFVLHNLLREGGNLFNGGISKWDFLDSHPHFPRGEAWRRKYFIQSTIVTHHIYKAEWWGYKEGKHSMLLDLPNCLGEIIGTAQCKCDAYEIFITKSDALLFLIHKFSEGERGDDWLINHQLIYDNPEIEMIGEDYNICHE